MCGLTDFASFAMVFAVSRGLAEGRAAPWYLGLVGAGLSFSAAVGSVLGGWLASRFDGRMVFVSGAGAVVLSIAACWFGDFRNVWLLPGYWLLGIGLGLFYPPLIGWLNQGENPHANRRVVSRTLILFCVAWNVGMMCGQLTAGALFAFGQRWVYGAALLGALPNLALAFVVAFQVRPFAPISPHRTHHENKALEVAVAFKRLSWIANLGGMFGASMIIHLLPDLAVAIGVHPQDHGKLLASWRGVIVGTYLLMHYTAHWHYRFSTALASQMLAACGLLVIAQSESSVIAARWTGTVRTAGRIQLLFRLVLQHCWQFRRTTRAGGWHSRGDAGWRNGHRHDGGRHIWISGRLSHALCCGSGRDVHTDRCAINCLVEVGATAKQEKG